jgi:rfaE bifunctional protein nucleotidyltransferase chain/domain
MRSQVAPVLLRSALQDYCEQARRAGAQLGLCNGAFDLLHVGHVRYLRAAAEQCDVLVVAVNADASVRLSKGSDRPWVSDGERAELVAAIAGVDAVHIFDEKDASEVIRVVRPYRHFKGTDYAASQVPEAALVQQLGGTVVIVGDPKDHSTTQTVQRLRDR